jgi:glycosyltransferase involved in cell wall biosynthesis
MLSPVFKRLSEEEQIKVKIIGGDIELEGVDIVNVKWSEVTEANEILSSDIGIMPLHNSLWENGKCGFKLIQYMACGLPVVASPSPANREIVLHGESGFIAKDLDEWYKYLKHLICNKEMRRSFGENGRERVEEQYSYQVWGIKYAKLVYENS